MLAGAGEVGEARALLRVLERRGIELSASQRGEIEGCSDLPQLERWLDLALVVASGEELFGGEGSQGTARAAP